MSHRINIHAHSVFSDGNASPYAMALEARRLNFSALVLTDHLYGNDKYNDYCSITNRSYHVRARCCREASEILPIIEGLEVPVGGEEVLLFGKEAVRFVLNKGKLTLDDLKVLRQQEHCAVILCHPHTSYEPLIEYVDGYELYNSGGHMFTMRTIHPDLDTKQAWANSDAHFIDHMKHSWSLTQDKIESENDLIKYIKSGQQPKHYAPMATKTLMGKFKNMFL